MAIAFGTPELFIMVVIPILIIFVIREIVCWYLKINKRVELMKEQNILLQSMLIEMSKTTQSIQDLPKVKETVKPEPALTKSESALTMPEPVPTKPKPVASVKKASPKVVKKKVVKKKAAKEEAGIVETPVVEKKQPVVKKKTNPYGFELSQEEQEQVELLIKQDMLSGEQVVISKRTRNVALFGIENWKSVDPTEWFILFEKP